MHAAFMARLYQTNMSPSGLPYAKLLLRYNGCRRFAMKSSSHRSNEHKHPAVVQRTVGAGGPLPPGTLAPDFALHSTPDQKVDLIQFRGRPVVLAFYPADWSPVCGDQLALYNEILSEFSRFGAQLLGISVDGAWCHVAYSHDRKLHFPLLSDFEPKGAVARQYGVYADHDGACERALFVIDA